MAPVAPALMDARKLSGHIVMISWSSWADYKTILLESDVAAVIVLDEETFRPSSPLPVLWDVSKNEEEPKFPVYLVRKVFFKHYIKPVQIFFVENSSFSNIWEYTRPLFTIED